MDIYYRFKLHSNYSRWHAVGNGFILQAEVDCLKYNISIYDIKIGNNVYTEWSDDFFEEFNAIKTYLVLLT